jgi:putative endonuclease
MSDRAHDYWIYFLTDNSRSALYIGVTSDLRLRVSEHRNGSKPGSFSERYHCIHLVYFEHFGDIRDAIAREKQLKGWRREKKNALIATKNPHWDDLAADWYD